MVLTRAHSFRTVGYAGSKPLLPALFQLTLSTMIHCATAREAQPHILRVINWNTVQHVLPLVPSLTDNCSHKGQHGRVVVVGGSARYTGAPYYAGMASLAVGADLASVYCSESATIPIKSYSPDLMVAAMFPDDTSGKDMTEEDIVEGGHDAADRILSGLQRAHAVVIGPGLGRDVLVKHMVYRLISEMKSLPAMVVLDADALALIATDLAVLRGYNRCVLTPNANELFILSAAVLEAAGQDRDVDEGLERTLRTALTPFAAPSPDRPRPTQEQRAAAARALALYLAGPVILLKGDKDIVATAEVALVVSRGEHVSPRRCGGQGDLLAGALGTIINWAAKTEHSAKHVEASMAGEEVAASSMGSANLDLDIYLRAHPVVLGCVLASTVISEAAYLAFVKHKRAALSTHVLAEIGDAFESISPVYGELLDSS